MFHGMTICRSVAQTFTKQGNFVYAADCYAVAVRMSSVLAHSESQSRMLSGDLSGAAWSKLKAFAMEGIEASSLTHIIDLFVKAGDQVNSELFLLELLVRTHASDGSVPAEVQSTARMVHAAIGSPALARVLTRHARNRTAACRCCTHLPSGVCARAGRCPCGPAGSAETESAARGAADGPGGVV